MFRTGALAVAALATVVTLAALGGCQRGVFSDEPPQSSHESRGKAAQRPVTTDDHGYNTRSGTVGGGD